MSYFDSEECKIDDAEIEIQNILEKLEKDTGRNVKWLAGGETWDVGIDGIRFERSIEAKISMGFLRE
jgi:hypothetical protein